MYDVNGHKNKKNKKKQKATTQRNTKQNISIQFNHSTFIFPFACIVFKLKGDDVEAFHTVEIKTFPL